MTQIEEFASAIQNSRRIVFFGGAGVSTESGLKDYRSADGIYKTATDYGMPPEEILHVRYFESNPELFYRFFRDFFVTDAQPNDTHRALVRLEKAGKQVSVVTQNIDGLHQKAGSSTVYELHGTTSRFHCRSCGKEYSMDYLKSSKTVIPYCECGEILKPHVTLYGEMLDDSVVEGAISSIADADLLIIGGTSLVVQPAASFVRYFRGGCTVIINKENTAYDSRADIVFHDRLGSVFAETMKQLDI